ncbi:MAG TPA: hypothetical protein HA276_00270 [Candidatus Poseidoniaceae archaeon]|nr:MAG: hypothetical protein CBD01_004360 [Euryarchaeota archaeon TMED141]DAC09586.1 MAG TPA: hypothetical protein D7I09_05730 [Candidatus Poseidoniales archaeon]DAC19241.1 MAG TPA: hypothetical protein D7I01_00265 [Candidatus Poseidoniales archaeon]HII18806.1 hypothetical protein [Candidatus Poseidoniaceae archaeon]HII96103.1 hypothetical protein [Candidatus Poseidoniaceae archaeon]|tara:strand:+ start:709 stop:948 length:240 start_codon:yes stop_codon:yes gene_type:complete
MDAVDLFGWMLAALAVAALVWMVRAAARRDQALDARLAAGDMSLFDEGNLDIEEVVRAPAGSTIQPGRLMEIGPQPPFR